MLEWIVRSRIENEDLMPAYRDGRTGRWRYRIWVTLPNGKPDRLTGTPPIDTKTAAEHAERLHVLRVTNPGLVQQPDMQAAPQPKEDLAAIEETPEQKETPAIEKALEQQALAITGKRPAPKEIPTIETFKDRFMREYLPRQSEGERAAKNSILKSSLLPFFGKLRLDEIDQSHVNAYVASQTVASKTVNNRLAVLSTLIKYAGPRGCKLIPELDLDCHIDALEAEVAAVPRPDVEKLLAATSDPRYEVAVRAAADNGLRIGEIRGLQWPDTKDGYTTIRRSVSPQNKIGPPKYNKVRSVRQSPALTAALAKLPRLGRWVICRRDGELLGYWTMLEALHAMYKRAGVTIPVSSVTGKAMPWHALRHSFGTDLAAAGVPLAVIKELMGHEDINTTLRYVTVNKAQRDAAIALVFGAERQPVGNDPTESG